MTASPTRAVLFDMDGVLVDSGAHHRDAWRATFAEAGLTPPPEFWRITSGRPADEAVTLLVRGIDRAEARRLAALKRRHYERLARRGAMAVPGVAAFVEALAGGGIPRAVGTSASRRDVQRVLDALGLRRHFDVVVTADDVRLGKPDPEVYLKAAAGLAVAPGACVVFEDAVVGVYAARAAGMRVVGVTSAHTAAELVEAGAERAVPDFAEVRWPV